MSLRPSLVYTAEGRLNTKLQRQRDIVRADPDDLPPGYKSNSIKEELALEYIDSFITQFCSIYTKRKIPFMVAENEFGVKKFVGATLRPTLISIPEIYDLYECASFLAGYILYEPLDPPSEPPKYLFSPQQVIDSHKGDSFDMANVLCSFLLGAGYDAYVVHGYAPKYIAMKDQSMTRCPMINEKNIFIGASNNNNTTNAAPSSSAAPVNETRSRKSEESVYIPPDNSVKSSKFLAEQAELKRLQAIDKFALWLGDEELLNEEEDLLAQQQQLLANADARESYVHCWVLVKAGRREIPENIFVEPSTGRIYRPSRSPYLAVEAVWNNTNFHVNGNLDARVATMDFNFYANNGNNGARSQTHTPRTPRSRMQQWSSKNRPNTTANATAAQEGAFWETLFLGEAPKKKRKKNARNGEDMNGGGQGEGDGPEEDDEEDEGNNDGGGGAGGGSGGNGPESDAANAEGGDGSSGALRFFDAPPKWSLPLSVPRAKYLAKHPPNGRRTVQYYCAKADFFARDTNDQGMVLRITRYLDRACTLVQETTEWYENRADHLYKRIRTFLDTKRNVIANPAQGYFQALGTSGLLGTSLQDTNALIALFGARRVVNHYQFGARDDIQCWTEFPGKCVAVDYYVAGRLDRMQRRVEVLGECLCEWFAGRHDRMQYRETLITTDRALALYGPQHHQLQHGRHGSMNNNANSNGVGSLNASRGTSAHPAARGTSAHNKTGTPAATAGAGALGSMPGTANASAQNVNATAMAGRHYLIARNHHLTLDLYLTRMTIDYAKDPAVVDGSDIFRRIFFIRDGKAVFLYHAAHQQVTGKTKTIFHTRNPGGGSGGGGGVPANAGPLPNASTNNLSSTSAPPTAPSSQPQISSVAGYAALSEAALAQESGLDDNQDVCLEAAALEREYYSLLKAACQEHERLVDAVVQVELTGNQAIVEREYSVFDQALDKVDAHRAGLPPKPRYTHPTQAHTKDHHKDAAHASGLAANANNSNLNNANNASNANKGVDYLAPFLKHVHDANQLTKEEALAIRQAALDALKARLVERASIIQSKLHEENSKLAKRQEQFQRSQREGDYSTEDFEKYCTEAMFRIQILENRLTAHEDAAPNKYAALDAKLSSDPRMRVLRA